MEQEQRLNELAKELHKRTKESLKHSLDYKQVISVSRTVNDALRAEAEINKQKRAEENIKLQKQRIKERMIRNNFSEKSINEILTKTN